jgi:hypothetical protein
VEVPELELRLPVVESPDGGAVVAPAAPVERAGDDRPDVGIPDCGEAPAVDCSPARKGKLTWRKKRLAWQSGPLGRGAAADLLGQPDATTAYRLCVWDKSQLVASLGVPAGACREGLGGTAGGEPGGCWVGKKKSTRYDDPTGSSDGVRSVNVAAGLSLQATGSTAPVRGARAQLLVGGVGCLEKPTRR